MTLRMSFLDRNQVEKAVVALKAYLEKSSESKKQLTSILDADKIQLQFTFKKVPKSSKVLKIHLPHRVVEDTTEICMFVKDIDANNRDHSKSVHFFKELLRTKGVPWNIEIMPLIQLTLEYKPFEAKRNLSNQYEVFLADDRIVRLLPARLGKSFYSRKRLPLQVDLQRSDLAAEFDKVLSSSMCVVNGHGSTGQVIVANTGQSDADVVDNIMSCVDSLARNLPGGQDNIRNMHLKTTASPALPIYISFGDKSEVTMPIVRRTRVQHVSDEITTVPRGKVRVSAHGTVTVIRGTAETMAVRHRKRARRSASKRKEAAARHIEVVKEKSLAVLDEEVDAKKKRRRRGSKGKNADVGEKRIKLEKGGKMWAQDAGNVAALPLDRAVDAAAAVAELPTNKRREKRTRKTDLSSVEDELTRTVKDSGRVGGGGGRSIKRARLEDAA